MPAVVTLAALLLALVGAAPADAGTGRPLDSDRDGLTDRFERLRSKTSPRHRDTDRDSLTDRYELRRSRTNPRRRDTDRDGMTDGHEVKRSKTNPRRANRRKRRAPSAPSVPSAPSAPGGPTPQHPQAPVDHRGPGGGRPTPPPTPAKPPPPPATPAFYLSATGSDAHSGTSPGSPLRTFDRAYHLAGPGDVVAVAPGTYAAETIAPDPGHSSPADVTFHATGPVSVPYGGDFVVGGAHITFEGPFAWERIKVRSAADITIRGAHVYTGTVEGTDGFRLLDSEVGPNAVLPDGPDDGLFIGTKPSRDILIDNTRFHDITRPRSLSHSDCIQFTVGTDVRVTRSRFENCYDHDIIIKGTQGPLTRFELENNFFDDVTATTSAFAIQLTGSTACEDCVVRNNSFVRSHPRIDAPTIGTARVSGNIIEKMYSVPCSESLADGWHWDYNVFETSTVCGQHAFAVPDGNVGYVDRAALDLRLTPGSEAIDRGNLGDFPAADIGGGARFSGNGPDAGAHEVG